ncbi:MAG: aldo/keto reductase [Chloroflexota bacterium]
MTAQFENIALGKTGIQVSPMGLGAWSWGDRTMWGYGRGYTEDDIRAAYDVSLAAGINFIDTAEVYGMGRSERFVGMFLPDSPEPLIVATKFFPFPWRFTKGALKHALRNSLERLNLERVDLYQIHWPFPPVPIETWADALADVVEAGLARAVGVSNYNEEQMRRAYATLAKRGVPLASNQVEYSLLDRKVEMDGLLKACQELGITVIAYSPLAKGMLSGKYTPEKPAPGLRGRKYNRALLENIQPLLRLMREISRQHDGATLAQVALNWCLCKDTLPIPGAKNARQAQDNAGALSWRLTDAQVAELDEVSAKLV